MDFKEIVNSFSDMFFIVEDSNHKIVYPDKKNSPVFYVLSNFEKKDDNTCFNPYTKQIYELRKRLIIVDDKEYIVTRYQDVTNYKNLVSEYVLDDTTGLFLRKKLLKSLNDYLRDAASNKESFSLTMLDIDFFKKINDTYGHQFGDECLNKLAALLHDKVHNNKVKNGILGRYGGEEFIFTINDTDFDYTKERNEFIREYIEEEMKVVNGKEINLTCSMGSVFVPSNQINDININNMPAVRSKVDSVIKQADKNLYMSKKNGRNCLTLNYYINMYN